MGKKKLKTVSLEELANRFGTKVPEKEEPASSYTLRPNTTQHQPAINNKPNKWHQHSSNTTNTKRKYTAEQDSNKRKYSHYDNTGTLPTAPYNFVPLNTVVLKPELASYIEQSQDMQSGYAAFIKNGKKYSGYFDVQIKNLTPLYIAGTNGFFSNGNQICIPGSSLRGCIKNIFKIVTNSGMNSRSDPDFTDKHLYYRAMASGYKPLRNAYKNRMVDQIKKQDGSLSGTTKAQAGFIVKKDKKYFICPGEYRTEKSKDNWKKAVEIANPATPYVKWNHENEAYIFTGKMHGSQPKKLSALSKTFSKERILGYGTDRNGNKTAKVDTSKVHYYKIFNPHWNILLPIPDEVIHDYIDDKNRKGLDLLNEKANIKNNNALHNQQFSYIIPCFYVEKNEVVEHFGAGPYYRIPYKHSIGDHIPESIKNPNLDFTSAVFGNKEYWASRVFFEDSFLSGSQEPQFYDKAYVKVLMGPNPTSFQFYLETKYEDPCHWDEPEAIIRGNKFYWHKKADWREMNPKLQKDSITKQIAPLKEGHQFHGKIRFKNLNAVELGALAYALSLGSSPNMAFKLGMGKPVGMGSVRLTVQLHIQGNDYYKKLFTQDTFTAAEPAEIAPYITQFTNYVESQLPTKEYADYKTRQDILRTLLCTDYMQRSDWSAKTRYYDVNDRSDKKTLNSRIPLPTAQDLIKGLQGR